MTNRNNQANRSPKFAGLLPAWILVLLGLLITVPSALAGPQVARAVVDPAAQAVGQAWEKAQQSNTYTFDTRIEQTIYPLPALSNVGRQPQTESVFLAGQRDRAQDLLEITLWQHARGSVESGIAVRAQEGRTFRRTPTGEWEEHDGVSDLFAPGGDPLVFLETAKNITYLGTDMRDLGGFALSYEQYAFDLDGTAYARVLRQRIEAQVAAIGTLPAGMTLQTPDTFQKTTGHGQLWLDGDGLPRRLEMTLTIPPQRNNGQTIARIVTDLSGFDRVQIEAAALPFRQSPSIWWQTHGTEVMTGAGQIAQTAAWLWFAVAILVMVLVYRRSRRFYLMTVSLLILSMILTPLLQSAQASAFQEKMQAAQAESAQRQAAAQAQADLQTQLEATDWLVHENPLSAVAGSAEPALTTASRSAAPALAASSTVTDTTDTDGDGLIDLDEAYWRTCAYVGAPENCTGVADAADSDGDSLSDGLEVHELGTHPSVADSDGDGISDADEISGFAYAGQTWYLNPLENDSNYDGLIDGLECRARTGAVPAAYNPAAVCPDTDGDGLPDVFDDDNDNDDVPDRDDLSPFSASTLFYGEETPLSLSISNLALDKPVFVDFQLRPANDTNLTLYNHVLDWPAQDGDGQIQRVLDTTWADTGNLALRSNAANAGNGDIRLVPMLEITMPYADGHYANLPITTTAPADRVLGVSVDEWVDSAELAPHGISVSDLDVEAGSLTALLPLTQITDRFGTPQAFQARMLYQPGQGANGRADWGAAQEVRLLWMVQIITDHCPAGYADEREEVNGAVEYRCVDPDSGATASREEVLTVGHIYPENWQLTGLSVSEEHDFDLAILYEDPAQDTDLTSDDQLLVASWNLSTGFLIGRDCESKDGNGNCVGNGSRDVTVENMASTVASWFTDVDYLTVKTYLNYEHSAYLAYLIGTEVQPLLDTHFGTHTDALPTFMYAQDQTSRELNLDSLTQYSAAGLVTFAGNGLTVDLDPADVPVQVKSSMSWTPYQFVDGAWQAAEVDAYLTRLDTRLQQEEYFQPADDSEAAAEAAADLRLWVQTYYASVWMGVTAITALAGQPLNVRGVNPHIPDTSYDPFFTPGTEFGATLLALAFFNVLGSSGANFVNTAGFGGIAGFTALILVTWAAIVLMAVGDATGNQQLRRIGEIILASLTLVIGGIFAIYALMAISNGGLSAGIKFKAISGVGVGIVLAVVWGLFLVSILTQDMSSIAIQVAASVAIATTVVLLFLFMLSLIGLGIIGILLAMVDAIFVLLDKKGPTQYITEAIASFLFDIDMSVTNLSASDRLDIQLHDLQIQDLRQGFRETNSVQVTMGITNTIKYHRDLSDDEERVALRNVFRYTLQTGQETFEKELDYWDNTDTDQWTPLDGRKLQTGYEHSLTVPLSSVGAGVNQPLALTYTESMLSGAQTCWNIPTEYGVVQTFCNWKKFRGATHYPLSSMLIYDIFPPTIEAFADMDWSDTIPALPQQVDMDADGVSDLFGTDPYTRRGTGFDTDEDGLGDGYEIANGTNPEVADTDGDGISDRDELLIGTNPHLRDTDGDGLNDHIETVEGWLFVYGNGQLARVWSDPNTIDADGDGLDDLKEFVFGFNPWTATDPSRITRLVQFDNLGVAESGAPQLLLQFEDDTTSTTFYDSSGQGNHATCTGDECPSVTGIGRYGQTVSFDGVDDYLRIPFVLNPGATPFTAAAWVKADSFSNQPVLLQQLDNNDTGRTWLSLNSNGTLNTFLGGSDLSGTTPAQTGRWRHAAVTYDGATLRLYLDGGLEAQSLRTLESGQGGMWIGQQKSGGRFLDGSLDDVVILDQALDADGITDLMNGRLNPDDNLLRPGSRLTYQATITNTSAATADGFLTTKSSYFEPNAPTPAAAFGFESGQRRAFFHNDTSEENRPYCFDAISCPTVGQAGAKNNGIIFDSDEDVVFLPTVDVDAGGSFGLAFWLKVDSLPPTGQRAMILDTASTDEGAVDIYINDSGKLVWDVVGDPNGPRVSNHTFNSGWTHVALIGIQWLFVNTVQDSFIPEWNRPDGSPFRNFKLGPGTLGNSIGSTQPLRGGIDELVYYWNNVSFDRLNAIINANYGNDYQLLYRFDDRIDYDGTVFYNSNNGWNTTCTGGSCPLLTVENRGYSGRALHFDGVNDYAYQSASNTYGDERTFTLYAKPTRYPSAGKIAYLYDATSTETNGDTDAIFNLYMDENGKLAIDYGWGAYTYTSFDPLPIDEWTKIEVTFKRNFNPTRYNILLKLDGVGNSADAPNICDTDIVSNCLYDVRLEGGNFGNSIDGTGPFTGLLDEIDFGAAKLTFDTPFVDFGYDNLASPARTSTCLFRASCPSITTGRIDDGLAFDGGDFLVVPKTLNPAKSDFSAAVWFKTSSYSGEPILLQQEDGSGAGRTWLGLRSGGAPYTFLGGSFLNSDTPISSGQWHHAAVTYDGATLRLYLDGALVAEEARSMEANDGSFWVGRPKPGVGSGYERHFTGEMDELVIVPQHLDVAAVQLLMKSSWPMIDIPAEFEPVSAAPVSSQTVSGEATVSAHAATSVHRVDQEVEAALVLQAQIDYPVIDDNAGELGLFLPFEDGPGSTIFDNLISYTGSRPDIEAVCLGGTCPTAGVRGQAGRAVYFDGIDDNLFIDSYSTGTGTNGPGNIRTVAVWVNAAQGTILDIPRDSGISPAGEFQLDMHRLRTTRGTDDTPFTAPLALPRNEWFHLVVTFDDSDTAYVYVNGVEIERSSPAYYIGTSDGIYIGSNQGGQDLLQGYLDDLRTYRIYLTPAEIETLYKTSAPLLRFEFDEEEDATLFTDNSINQYVGKPRMLSQSVDGEPVSQPSPAPGTKGRIGNGALFDGQGYIEVSGAEAASTLANTFSIMAWVRPQNVGSGTERLFGAGNQASVNGYNIALDDGKLLFQTNGIQEYRSSVTVEPDKWQHVAVVFDSNNDAHFYLDGVFQQTIPGAAPAAANLDDPLFFGARTDINGNVIQSYTGMIDELAVYGRSLTEAELFGIYLRELRWYRDRAVTYLTIDSDAPAIQLLSDETYWPNGYIQLAVATTDPTSAVRLLDFGLKAPGESAFTWQGATPCAESDSRGGAWCPSFDSSLLGGEGVYEFQFRAVDAVGNETTSPVYSITVDATPPTAASGYVDTWMQARAANDVEETWVVALTGTVSDPDLAPAIAGSGVATQTVLIDLLDSAGLPYTDAPQQATVTGNSWSLDYQMSGQRPEGRYSIYLTLSDQVGNQAALTVGSLWFDARPPAVDLNDWSLGGVISQTTVLSGTIGEIPDWGDNVLQLHFEEPAGATDFYNTASSQFYTPTHSSCTQCPTAGAPALFGKGVQFDGVDDQIQVPFVLNPGTNQFSLATWFKVTDLSSNQVILQQLTDSGVSWLYVVQSNGKLQTNLGGVLATTTSVTPGQWHHAALTYDGTTLAIYLDGELAASGSQTPGSSAGDLRIGANKGNASLLKGMLDEFNLYDRALSTQEIRALAQREGIGVAQAYVTLQPAFASAAVTDTLIYLPMGDAPTGDWLADQSGNGLHFTCDTNKCPAHDSSGAIGSGLGFGQNNQWAYIPDNPALNFAADQNLSIGLWVRFDQAQLAGHSEATIVSKIDTTITEPWAYLLAYDGPDNASHGRIRGHIYEGNQTLQLNSTARLTDSDWHHLLFMRRDKMLYLYIDGQLDASMPDTTSQPLSNSQPVRLGLNGSSVNFLGEMDEFYLFDRAVSEEEIALLSAPLPTLPLLADPGALASTWQTSLPNGLEDYYELNLWGRDTYGNSSRRATAWRGLIDMVSPVITVTAQHTWQMGSPVTEYSFTFSDFMLDAASYDQPCTANDMTAQTYTDATLPQNGQPYEVSATCQVPGHESSRNIRACDAAGNCTTETAIPSPVYQYPLIVATEGTGSGLVSTVQAGIDCGNDCHENYDTGTVITLVANADSNATFTGWGGACSGTGDCTVTMSEARTVTATFDLLPIQLPLQVGWNLLGYPLTTSQSITDALASAAGDFDIVWGYDAGSWRRYAPGVPGNSLHQLETGDGVWIHATANTTVALAGTVPNAGQTSLNSGWNLFGYAQPATRSVTDTLASIAGDFDIVWGYDAGNWQRHAPGVPGNSLHQMETGDGFWIRTTSPVNITWGSGQLAAEDEEPVPVASADILVDPPLPPAVFYGSVQPVGLAQAGQLVELWAEDLLCATTQLDAALRYQITIPADSQGCGQEGQPLTLLLAGGQAGRQTVWQAGLAQQMTLSGAEYQILMPLLSRP